MEPISKEDQLRAYYHVLFAAWGRQHWWPGRTRFEVIVGAYLTQNTSWTNVERALRSLRASGLLTIHGIRRVPLRQLEALLRCAGYFRQKARRLKTFVKYLDQQYGGSLNRMFAQRTEKLREELLALNGIGPETADSILLYAGNHPVFVVDAYTRRILDRHDILAENSKYEEIRQLFERALADAAGAPVRLRLGQASPADSHQTQIVPGPRNSAGASHLPSPMSTARRSSLVQVYNEMHGLIVGVGKNYCLKAKALCEQCPLQGFLVAGRKPINREQSPRK